MNVSRLDNGILTTATFKEKRFPAFVMRSKGLPPQATTRGPFGLCQNVDIGAGCRMPKCSLDDREESTRTNGQCKLDQPSFSIVCDDVLS